MSEGKQPRKNSSVRHTRAVQKSRISQPIAAPSDEQVRECIQELVHPSTLSQASYFHRLGLRERTLSFVVMVAFILEMIWRQIGSVNALSKIVQQEAILWEQPRKVSQQALSRRLTSLPSELFLRVLLDVLPKARERWMKRERPLPPELVWAAERYRRVLTVDGSTLDALIRKIGLLRDLPENLLAGRMTALLDICTRLPEKIWYESDPKTHDQRFWEEILSVLKVGDLLIFDKGYLNFSIFTQLTRSIVKFITRGKTNLAYKLERAIIKTAAVHDYLVWIGNDETRQKVRLIEILYRGKWYRYMTNELDEKKLPTAYVVALYWQRWRIEDAYNIVKRLLGLAYFWCGAQNAVEMQIWATWLMYVVLVDLTDAVAEALNQPFGAISIEMVYRSLYFFTNAKQQGKANDIVAYLAKEAKFLGIIKRKHKGDNPSPLVFVPALLTGLPNP
jgi:Transposase DDE domain